jgi:hypothetical protein
MLARLVGDEMDEGAKWECNKTKNKGEGPFFPTPYTDKAYEDLGKNLCTKILRAMQ